MGNLDGKVVFVTGASSGIGRASAKVLVNHGASVVIASRREDESNQLVKELQSAGANIEFIRTDVSDEKQVEAAIGFTIARFGGLHGAFNNAGGGFKSEFDWPEATSEQLDKTFELNMKGVWLCMKYEWPTCSRTAVVRLSAHRQLPGHGRSRARPTPPASTHLKDLPGRRL